MSTQGDGMAEVTEADREKAVQIAFAMRMVRGAASILPIASALAEEREKARAPFLEVMRQIPPDSPELRWVADRIQRAADGVTA